MQILTRFNKVIAYSPSGYTPVGNSAICAVTNDCYHDVLIVNVDCVPTDINHYEYYYVDGKFIKGCSKTEFVETNKYDTMRRWVGTQAEYDAIEVKDIKTFYYITDGTSQRYMVYIDMSRLIDFGVIEVNTSFIIKGPISIQNVASLYQHLLVDYGPSPYKFISFPASGVYVSADGKTKAFVKGVMVTDSGLRIECFNITDSAMGNSSMYYDIDKNDTIMDVGVHIIPLDGN